MLYYLSFETAPLFFDRYRVDEAFRLLADEKFADEVELDKSLWATLNQVFYAAWHCAVLHFLICFCFKMDTDGPQTSNNLGRDRIFTRSLDLSRTS
jgi:hypothetical protein